MNRFTKILMTASLFLCIPATYAQNCNPTELSPQGLEHLNKAIAYLKLLEQGTEKQAITEYEAILQTDSLWCPEHVYQNLGGLCARIAEKDKEIIYYNKAIHYYEKYMFFMPMDSIEINGIITQLETTKKVLEHTICPKVKNEMVFVEGMLNEDTTSCIHSFYIGKYELTQEQWESVMQSNPSHFRGPNLPVEQICDKYNFFLKEVNRITGANYRLPSSTEWFYAARGGKNMENYSYSGGFAENKVAWFSSNSGDRTHEVGEKEPNSLGIYDMSGNVSELVYVDNPKTKQGHAFPIGGNYRSAPFDITDDKNLSSTMKFEGDGELINTTERRKNYQGFYQDYTVKKTISSHIGIRLVQDVDLADMSSEEQQWDSWIQQKAERVQKEIEKEQRKQERKNLWRNGNRHWYGHRQRATIQGGIKYDYNFYSYGDLGPEDVFVNQFFGHSMLGINVRFPIGAFIYIEPQIKAGIESNWKLVSEQDGFLDQLSTCFNNVQTIYLDIPLIIGGIYRLENQAIAFRGYTGGQIGPRIETKKDPVGLNNRPSFAILYGFGIDLGLLTTDFYYRKPLTTEPFSASGFSVSVGLIFGNNDWW